ncbi:hypothetical protein ACFL5R_01200 [Pseudomonadota bacterium]
MSDKDWIAETHNILKNKYKETVGKFDLCDDELPDYYPDIQEWEAKYFILGLEADLFSIDEMGYVQSCMLPQPPKGSDRQKMIQLFWNFKGGKRRLYREGVCQMATASYLCFFYGWDSSAIEMEPDIKNYGKLAYATDMLVKGETGNCIICCEVKKDEKEFSKLIDGFSYCCSRGQHNKQQCKYARDHAKYEICNELRPLYFLATSPTKKRSFKLEFCGKNIVLNEVKTLPNKY